MERLEALIAERQIIAPFDGIVLKSKLRPGQQVDAYDEVITVGDPTEMVVRALYDYDLSQSLNKDSEVPLYLYATIDLSKIPGPQAHRHDDTFTTGLRRGELSVTNPRLGLRFQMEWDKSIFPWVVVWQPCGGADEPPLTGIYGRGIEPWVARYPLAQAIEEKQARWLGRRGQLVTRITCSIFPSQAS